MAERVLLYPDLSQQPILDVLRLIRSENVGALTFFRLIAHYGTARRALDALPELATAGGKKAFRVAAHADALMELEAAERFGARMIPYGNADYPALLHAIEDAPPVLTVVGKHLPWKDRDCMAIVGARNASANGCHFAGILARELGKQHIVTVSGLARGIDTGAHKSALATGTIAVIAGGIDNIYPPENAALYHAIQETGCVISEQPFGSLPFAGSFPGRNRIISGISRGTIVVEASPRSGSLITARFAAEQGREVFAVPGSPMDPRSRGCNSLLRHGAMLTETIEDILGGLGNAPHRHLAETSATKFTVQPQLDEQLLAQARTRIREQLSPVPVFVDELLAQCQYTPGIVHTVLLEMELAGMLLRSSGNRVALRASALAEASAETKDMA